MAPEQIIQHNCLIIQFQLVLKINTVVYTAALYWKIILTGGCFIWLKHFSAACFQISLMFLFCCVELK